MTATLVDGENDLHDGLLKIEICISAKVRDCTLMLCSDGLVLFIGIVNRRTESRSCNCSSLLSYSILHHKLNIQPQDMY